MVDLKWFCSVHFFWTIIVRIGFERFSTDPFCIKEIASKGITSIRSVTWILQLRWYYTNTFIYISFRRINIKNKFYWHCYFREKSLSKSSSKQSSRIPCQQWNISRPKVDLNFSFRPPVEQTFNPLIAKDEISCPWNLTFL